MRENLGDQIRDLRLGLILLLPYFTYSEVDNEDMQADPHGFATATAEALKYYDERHFLDICEAIYAVGERLPAHMPVPAVGAKDQRNPPHFVELVAGLGAIRFMAGSRTANGDNVVSLAGREGENTVRWADLPTANGLHSQQMELLQQFALFAVAYHYIVYPDAMGRLHGAHAVIDHLQDVPRDQAGQDLAAVDSYLQSFLAWLLSLSTPHREGVSDFIPGLVEVNVFGVRDSSGWRLKTPGEFQERQIGDLFRNLEERRKPNVRAIFRATTSVVKDPEARGAGKLVRAIYDACKLS